MKATYKVSFDRWCYVCRWTERKYNRPCDWVIIGISKRWSGSTEFCYRLSLFGLEWSIWFTQTLVKNHSTRSNQ